DQALAAGIDRGIEALQRACAEQGEVARAAEDDLVDGLEVAAADHRDADVTRDPAPIRHHEVLIALEHVDPDRAQQALGEPRHLGAGVHEDLTDARPPGLPARPADLDVHAERAHGPADSGTRVAHGDPRHNARPASMAREVTRTCATRRSPPPRARAPPPAARRPSRAAGPPAAGARARARAR